MSEQAERRGPSGRSRADWEQLVASYEQGGLSRKDFCAHASISVTSLDYWRRKLREEQGEVGSPGFIELSPLSSLRAGGTWQIELALGEGVVLKLSRS